MGIHFIYFNGCGSKVDFSNLRTWYDVNSADWYTL